MRGSAREVRRGGRSFTTRRPRSTTHPRPHRSTAHRPTLAGHRPRWHREVACSRAGHAGVTVADDETFTPGEWATLRFAPFWVLAALAGCYRGFDPLEFEAFSRAVEEASDRARGRLGGEVLQRVS